MLINSAGTTLGCISRVSRVGILALPDDLVAVNLHLRKSVSGVQ